jgi:hypothetical protein
MHVSADRSWLRLADRRCAGGRIGQQRHQLSGNQRHDQDVCLQRLPSTFAFNISTMTWTARPSAPDTVFWQNGAIYCLDNLTGNDMP